MSEQELLDYIGGPDAGGNSAAMAKGYQLWGLSKYYNHMNHYIQHDPVSNKTVMWVFESGTSESLMLAWTQLVSNMRHNNNPNRTTTYPMATWSFLDMTSPNNFVNFMGLHQSAEAQLRSTLAMFGSAIKFSKTFPGAGSYVPISKNDDCTGQIPRTVDGKVDFSSVFPLFTDPP
jgi:hypothetical protein